jgi:signal transduction histidine kinase
MKLRLGRLAVRVYAFALITVVLSVVLLGGLIKYTGDPPWFRSFGATVALFTRQLGERYPTREALLAHLDDATRGMQGNCAVYDRGGRKLWSSPGDDSAAPTGGEWRDIERVGVVVVDDRLGAAIAGHPELAFTYHPTTEFSGLGFAIAVCAVLFLILLSSLWFARGIVRPLRRLEEAATAFGSGDTTVRARVTQAGELGAVGTAFDAMADRIVHLLRTQRELLADISHELRTPLARIRVAIELATEDPVAAQDVLSDVGIDLAELEQIIDDLLTVVRLDLPDASNQLPRAPLAVDELLRRAGERFAVLHPRRALELGGDAGGVVNGHGALLRRAIDNLLDNAAKYSPDGAPITLAAQAAGDRVIVQVVDRGAGMTAEQLNHAFTPFWRADDSRSRGTGGVGLGLALARRVARAHGGDVTLRSTPGAGTTAQLTIPLTTSASAT